MLPTGAVRELDESIAGLGLRMWRAWLEKRFSAISGGTRGGGTRVGSGTNGYSGTRSTVRISPGASRSRLTRMFVKAGRAAGPFSRHCAAIAERNAGVTGFTDVAGCGGTSRCARSMSER